MPGQIIPIADLASGGVIADTPSMALGPNMFSDVMNVRFKDSAVRKMEGEDVLISAVGGNSILHVAWWPHPDLSPEDGYYVLVVRDTDDTDRVAIYQASDRSLVAADVWGTDTPTAATEPSWQSLLFDGGRTLILNNGIETPRYINNVDNTFLALPGWDSYLVNEPIVTSLEWNFVDIENINIGVLADLTGTDPTISTTAIAGATDYRVRSVEAASTAAEWAMFFIAEGGAAITTTPIVGQNLTSIETPGTVPNLGTVARVGDQQVIMTVNPANADLGFMTFVLDDLEEPAGFAFSLSIDAESQTNFIIPARRTLNEDGSVLQAGVADGDIINISVFNLPAIRVRCGTLRAFGQFLVAGNLTETRIDDPTRTVRRLAGTVRTSDVAPPGTVPANWNPFRIGANTADEFTLSSTGVVQDMAVLQGNLMIYTNNSIHSLQNTGNPTIPFALRPVSESYGCQTRDAVLEFDGRHVVIGSNDIYQFQGHPGSIASIADARVRRLFYDSLDPAVEQMLFMLINRREDEIWICYPDINDGSNLDRNTRALIWNYRDNTWTIRKMTGFFNGVMAPLRPVGSTSVLNPNIFKPLFTSDDTVFFADSDDYTDTVGVGYESYVERERLALTPEFDTETLMSMALLAEPTGVDDLPVLRIRTKGTYAPAELPDFSSEDVNTQNFVVKGPTVDGITPMEYKSDHRTQGRFLNYRIDDVFPDMSEPPVDVARTDGWNLIGMQFEVGKGGTR